MVAVLLIAFFALLIFGTPIITALMGSSLLSFAMYSTKDLKAVARCADVQRRDQQKTNQVL